MKRTMLVALSAFATVFVASADVLLWQVSETQGDRDVYEMGQQITAGGSGDFAWTYAYIKSTTTTADQFGLNSVVDDSSDTILANYVVGGDVDGVKKVTSDLVGAGYDNYAATYNSGNVYIALYNDSNALVGFSALLSGEELAKFKTAATGEANWSSINSWTGGAWTAAPEPTSGIMLLFGAAMLGLRRRKLA